MRKACHYYDNLISCDVQFTSSQGSHLRKRSIHNRTTHRKFRRAASDAGSRSTACCLLERASPQRFLKLAEIENERSEQSCKGCPFLVVLTCIHVGCVMLWLLLMWRVRNRDWTADVGAFSRKLFKGIRLMFRDTNESSPDWLPKLCLRLSDGDTAQWMYFFAEDDRNTSQERLP